MYTEREIVMGTMDNLNTDHFTILPTEESFGSTEECEIPLLLLLSGLTLKQIGQFDILPFYLTVLYTFQLGSPLDNSKSKTNKELGVSILLAELGITLRKK